MTSGRSEREIRRYLLCCSACCLWLAACSRVQEASQNRELAVDLSRTDVPLVMFHRYPFYPPPGIEPPCGPVVGVWPDGRIVRVASEETIGESYVEGKLTAEQLQQLLKFIATHERLLKLEEGGVIEDAASERLGIRLKNHCISYEETTGEYAQLQHNPDMAQLRQYLMSIGITEPRPCGAPWTVPPDDWYE